MYKINSKGEGSIGLIDIGSVGGLPKPWNTNSDHINFLLNFDPNVSPVKGTNFLTYNTAVWEKDAVLPFYIYKGFNGTGSSLFKQNYDYVRCNYEQLKKRGPQQLAETWFDRSELIESTKLKCRAIDNILTEELNAHSFHFMKIDAQGAEYKILEGSKNFLSENCIGLHLELFVIPLYKEIKLLPEVEAYLNGFGFQLAKKFPAHGTFDSQHDCLFLKQNGNSEKSKLIMKMYEIDTK